MIKKGVEIELNVRPIYIGLVHDYFFEGPCRMATTEEVAPEFEAMMHPQICQNYQKLCEEKLGGVSGINLMDPVFILRHDDMLSKEEFFEDMSKDLDQVDLFLVGTQMARADLVVELAERTGKPIMIQPQNCCMAARILSQIRAHGQVGYGFFYWEEAIKQMQALRIRKALAHTNILQAVRMDNDSAITANSFMNHYEVTRILGVKFRGINLHELIDQITPGNPMENHCTPGRKGLNPTAEDMKEIERITDEIIAGASHVGMNKDKIMISVRGWYIVQKMLEYFDCNAFTAPCPDFCATRRANEENLTFCFAHSLNNEIGIPSSCEGDTIALVSKQILSVASGCSTYMGETNPLVYENGVARLPSSPANKTGHGEEMKEIENEPNLYTTFHAVPNRKFHGHDKPDSPYGIQPFTYSGWGATMRYDFNQDKGQPITLCRLSPDCKKIFIGKGTIMGGTDYMGKNCSQSVIYQVKDSMDFYQKQLNVGSHVCLTYGDVSEVLKLFGESVGLEVLEA